MKTMRQALTVSLLVLSLSCVVTAATYMGSQYCGNCHGGILPPDKYAGWQQTLHAKIHQKPALATVTGDFTAGAVKLKDSGVTDSVTVTLTKVNDTTYTCTIGGNIYTAVYTYGGGWKQRYLILIDSSYYMLPIQWNSNKYKDNSTGQWVAYSLSTWFNSDGTPKATTTNSFRKKSWDKNCSGCHVTGVGVHRWVSNGGLDTAWVSTWANYATDRSKDIVVGCETCHGPGSAHPPKSGIVNPANLPYERQIEVCFQCHFRGASSAGTHEYPWDEVNAKGFVPGDTLSKYISIAAPNTTGGPGTWPDSITARQHHQQSQDFARSRHQQTQTLTCWTCHDPHQNTAYAHQLKVNNDDNSLCWQSGCHLGIGPKQFADTAAVMAHTHHSYDPATTGTSRCTKCHMPKTAITAKAYDIHLHDFMPVPPTKTLAYKNVTTPTKGMLSSCAASCHRASNVWGIIDNTLTDWTEASDVALAESLQNYYGPSGIWWQTTGVKVEPVDGPLPKQFLLSQNYPNPFNPVTTIQFSVPHKSRVTITVYNLLGQQVALLLDEIKQLGNYTLTWDGKTDDGTPVPSGVYLYRLQAGDSIETRKMVLIK